MICGYYGKLPSHGDFLDEGLPRAFVVAWDAWLQQAMRHAEDMLGAEWEDAYAAAPAWTFEAGPDVLHAGQAVCGVLAPSTDKVGRLFPCTLVCIGTRPDSDWYSEALAAMAAAMTRGPEALRAFLARPPEPDAGNGTVSDSILWRRDDAAMQAPLEAGLFLRLLQPALLADHGGAIC